MFQGKTVFILGAGASRHYGYPTGEDLVKLIINKCKECIKITTFPNDTRKPMLLENSALTRFELNKTRDQIISSCTKLIKNLEDSDALVIDYFLYKQSKEIQEIGKFMIAWVILDCEKTPLYNSPDPNHNWIRFILHKLTNACEQSSDLLKNQVSFVTFNYDVSLEQGIINGLRAMMPFFKEEDIKAFFANNRFIHIYGQIRNPNNLNFFPDPIQELTKQQTNNYLFEKRYTASQTIFTIEEVDKSTNATQMDIAKEKINSADNVYVLGFGFDRLNCERIGLSQLKARTDRGKRKIYLTNFGNKNVINKQANSILIDGSFVGKLVDHSIVDNTAHKGNYYEKSTKDVYQALADDFGLLEN